jgi:arylsulfatase A-like enzyme/Tfp pilus assembly protein PilF
LRNWKVVAVVLVAVGVVAAFYFFKSPPPKPIQKLERNNFILISIDTTRADSIGAYGNKEIKTPIIDSFAQDGTLFRNAVAHVPLTLPSHTALMTGLLPARNGVRDNHGYRLKQTIPTMASLFRDKGYKTAAFVSSIVLDHRFGLDHGFDTYNDFIQFGAQQSVNPQNERLASVTTTEAINWLSANQQYPYFLFVHYYDPHAKYDPPEPYKSNFPNHYFGEIAYVDSQIGALLRSVKDLANTVILITADHGEGLGEHGELGHGLFIYDSTIHIPFLMKGPGIGSKKEVAQQVQLVDILPTFLDLAGISKPQGLDGRSLLPLLQGNSWSESIAILETEYPLGIGWSPLYAARSSQWKVIDAPGPELYNIKEDPKENKNEQGKVDSTVRGLSDKLQKYKNIPPMSEKSHSEDAELQEQLRSLGYLSGSSKPKDLSNLPDPKSKIDVWKLYEQSTFLSMEGKKAEAVELLERAAKLDSSNPILWDTLAQFVIDEDAEKAVEYWQKALRLSPEDNKIHHRLALGFKRLGEIDKSIVEEQVALKIDPEMQEALLGLAETLISLNKPQEALTYLQKSLELDPRNAAAAFQTGNVYLRSGDLAQAASYFEKSIQYNPSLPQSYYSLAIIKGQSGDLTGAEELLKKSLELNPSFAEAYFNLGIIYERMGRKEESLQAYQNFINYADPKIHAARIEQARQKLLNR